METSCTPQKRCNAEVTTWIDGTHPTVADGQVSRKVCFRYGDGDDNCCWRFTNIQVRNCSSFHVYYLKSVPSANGNARYCGTD